MYVTVPSCRQGLAYDCSCLVSESAGSLMCTWASGAALFPGGAVKWPDDLFVIGLYCQQGDN